MNGGLMNDDFDWNINIVDQCAKPEDFDRSFMKAAWDSRWDCPEMIADPMVFLYGC